LWKPDEIQQGLLPFKKRGGGYPAAQNSPPPRRGRARVGVEKMANIPQLPYFPLPFVPSHQPFDVLTVPRKIEGGRGE
jgi:hypothetical protein